MAEEELLEDDGVFFTSSSFTSTGSGGGYTPPKNIANQFRALHNSILTTTYLYCFPKFFENTNSFLFFSDGFKCRIIDELFSYL